MHHIRKHLSILPLIVVLVLCLTGVAHAALTPLGEQIVELFNQANAAMQKGNYDEAIETLDEALRLSPENMYVLGLKATCYVEKKQYPEAIAVLNKALELDPKHALALYNRAVIYDLMANLEQAKQDLKLAITYYPPLKQLIKSNDSTFNSLRKTDDFQKLTAISLIVDGRTLDPLHLDASPANVNGRVLVPLRAIFEALGAEVQWDPVSKTVIGKKNQKTVTLRIDDSKASIDAKDVVLDVPPTIMNNRTMVPVRFISEALGSSVTWDDKNQAVFVYTPGKGVERTVTEESTFINNLYKALDISLIDGAWPNPYRLNPNEAYVLFIAKKPEDLQQFQSLTPEAKKRFFAGYILNHLNDFINFKGITATFIYDGKANGLFYQAGAVGSNTYIDGNIAEENVVIQDKNNYNYKYYYQAK